MEYNGNWNDQIEKKNDNMNKNNKEYDKGTYKKKIVIQSMITDFILYLDLKIKILWKYF